VRPVSLLFGPTFALLACNGSTASNVPPVAYKGALPASVPARFLFNTLTALAQVDGAQTLPILVDTGSPMTGVDPASWPKASLAADVSTLPSLTVGALDFEQVPVVPLTECGASCGPFDVTGVLGGNVLRSFVVGFDYQAPAVIFGPGALPADALTPPTTISVDLAGGGIGTIAGGDGQQVDVPPTRLVVEVTLEGTVRTLVVDTGSSYTLLSESLFSTIISDGRAVLTLDASTATGGAQIQVARSRTMNLGGIAVAGSPIAGVPDATVANLTSEVGRNIDGLLGGSVLSAFYTLVDYGGQQLSLYPFRTRDPLADEFVRVGVFLAEDGAGYVIGQGVAPSSKSLLGQTVVDVDGTAVAGLDPDQADRLLRGQAGTSHTLHLQAHGATNTATLPVADVLPLMQ
jgi:hypothetical protein